MPLWCTPGCSCLSWSQALPCHSPFQASLEKQSCGMPLFLWSCISFLPSFLGCSGPVVVAAAMETVAMPSIAALWHGNRFCSSVPTELSAVCLPQLLTTTVVLIQDEGRIGVNCQLWTERGSVDKISQYCVLNLEYYTGLETFSLKIVLQSSADCEYNMYLIWVSNCKVCF